MFDIDYFQEIWQTITRNKWRSFFTAFGVFWGVFMLVVMVGVGSSIRTSIYDGISQLRVNTAFFFTNTTSIPYKGFSPGRYWNLTIGDAEAVKKSIPEVEHISPVIFGNGSNVSVVHNNKTGSFRIMGYAPDMNIINPLRFLQGRFINELDVAEYRKVCLIGKRIYDELYQPNENAVGSLIRVSGIYYTVIGVCDDWSDKVNIFGTSSEMVIFPYSTMMRSQNLGDKIGGLSVSVSDDVDADFIEEKAGALLRERGMVAPDDKVALSSFNLKQQFDIFSSLILGLNILVWIVGLGTLFSGVVGVSNIMLITVRERTQEIGVRRALGATPFSIVRQVMSESLLLTFLAGSLGLTFAVVVMSIASKILAVSPDFPMKSVQIPFDVSMAALSVIIFFGLVAGYLPSRRALSIKAVEALQDE